MIETSASLLERLREQPNAPSWQRLVDLYQPLLSGWLRRNGVRPDDVEDLVQDVLQILVRELPRFQYDPKRGSFRGWLRTITVNRLRMFWRAQPQRHVATGDADLAKKLDQLEDPRSQLSQIWDREHDEFVARRLLELIKPEFEGLTWQAFVRVTLESADSTKVAAELNMSLNAVYLAKYRVLRRLRQEIAGLTD